MTDWVVPFNRVVPVGREFDHMRRAVEGGHISGDGPFTRACEALLERELGVPRVLLTTSCTHALEMAAILLNIEPGDEVIVPAFTFVSTVNAFVLRGARPVFVDIREDTLNLDERMVAAAITARTKAIVVVHYAGVACAMEPLGALAADRGIPIVEDNAHGLFGRYRQRWLGTFGQLATLSFHETKNFSCGEGGALVINDPRLVERGEVIREKGTDRSKFLRGEVDKYTWRDLGSSYIPSDLLAAFLLGQLEARDEIQGRRRAVFERYEAAIGPWAHDCGFTTLWCPADCDQPYHLYYVRLADKDVRQWFMDSLRSAGILAVSHYLPLHLSPMGRRYGNASGSLPVTERVSDQLVRLPFFACLSEHDQRTVTDAIVRLDPLRSSRTDPVRR